MTKPLRFCMITTFYPPYNFGGDGIFVQRLSHELAKRGHEVAVIHCRDAYLSLAGKKPVQDYDDHPNVTVHGLKSGWGILSPLATHQTGIPFFKSKKIREILDKGFDVIHYHNISLVGGPKLLAYGSGIKLYSLHEYWLVCPTHVLFKFNRAACRKKTCLRCTLRYKRPPQWWRYTDMLQRAARHVDAFIAPSRFIADKHRELGFEGPFHHLPYFIPSQENSPGERTLEKNRKPYFLFIGRLEKLKGLQTLIPFFKTYEKAQLLIAGRGNYEVTLKHIAGDSQNIRFLGHIAADPVRRLLRDATALIVPSLCYEAFPLVVVEAFRSKAPVIARNLGGLSELVEESGGGLIYDSDEKLLVAVDRLTQDPVYRRELGLQGYRAFLEKWTAEVHLKGYFELIDRILASKSTVL